MPWDSRAIAEAAARKANGRDPTGSSTRGVAPQPGHQSVSKMEKRDPRYATSSGLPDIGGNGGNLPDFRVNGKWPWEIGRAPTRVPNKTEAQDPNYQDSSGLPMLGPPRQMPQQQGLWPNGGRLPAENWPSAGNNNGNWPPGGPNWDQVPPWASSGGWQGGPQTQPQPGGYAGGPQFDVDGNPLPMPDFNRYPDNNGYPPEIDTGLGSRIPGLGGAWGAGPDWVRPHFGGQGDQSGQDFGYSQVLRQLGGAGGWQGQY